MTKEPDVYAQTFEEAVVRAFGPIIDDFGFALTRVKEWMFELKSQNCLVVIFLERQQVFIDVKPVRLEQVRNGKHFRGLDLGIIINCLDPTVKFKYRAIREPENTHQEIDRLAAQLRKYCTSMLKGNFSDWSNLMECREKGTWRSA